MCEVPRGPSNLRSDILEHRTIATRWVKLSLWCVVVMGIELFRPEWCLSPRPSYVWDIYTVIIFYLRRRYFCELAAKFRDLLSTTCWLRNGVLIRIADWGHEINIRNERSVMDDCGSTGGGYRDLAIATWTGNAA